MKLTVFTILFTVLFTTACTLSSKNIKPPKENTYRMWIEAKIPSTDPHASSDMYSHIVSALFYDTLFEYHYLKKPLQLMPSLADGLPEISKDSKTFKIKIKQGIRFHDDPCFAKEKNSGKGRELKIDDVIYSIHRIMDKKTRSPMMGSFSGILDGADEFNQGKAESIKGLKKIDDYTLEIKLIKPRPRFVYNFADSKTAVMAKECVEKYGDEISRHPVGTGPFLPKQLDLNYKVVALKNPNYRHVVYPGEGMPGDEQKGLLADAGRPLPFIDQVVIEVHAETQPAFLKFKNGEFEHTSVPKDNYSTVLPGGKLSPDMAARGVQHFREPRGDVTVTIFNVRDKSNPWAAKKALRHAFALAIDSPKIIEIQYSGQGIVAQSVVDPTMVGYDPKFKSKWSVRNVAKAKELIAKAGYPDGKGLPPVVMVTSAGTLARQLDELMTRQLAEAGITLKSEAMTWPEMMNRVHSANFTIVGMAYGSTIPDFDDGSGLFHSKNIATGYNPSGYHNRVIDNLIDEIEEMPDGLPRLAKIKKFKELADDDLPVLVHVHRIGNALVQPWVKNFVYTDSSQVSRALKYRKLDLH